MKKILFLLLFAPFLLIAQSEQNPCVTLSRINDMLQKMHYKPKPVDDSLSVFVYTNFLTKLDENNRLFTEADLEKFKDFKYQIDDFILTKDCSFLDVMYQTYNQVVERYIKAITTLNTENFPSSSNENIVLSRKSFPYLKNETEIQTLYRKRILFTILREIGESSTNKDSLTANFKSIYAERKAKVFEKFLCKATNLHLTKEEFTEQFYSVFCSYFDPHSDYFSQKSKSSFFSFISSDNLSFGFYVSQNNNDEFIVAEILPGSAAYFSEKIEKNDVLLKITHNQTEYVVDCIPVEKLFEILNSDAYKLADFTFKKVNGLVYNVTLSKKVLKDVQNNVYSFVLKNGDKKFGYIKIPSFYATFDNGKSSVSQDVAKEVFKLNEEKIDGLIIDLQYNGGGSLEEGILLSGLFIDIGPVAVMNDKNQKRNVLKDYYRGSIFSGNMVVLVNGLSASASELFANAMQDYQRAIIVGNTTLGKATMQQVFPIQKSENEFVKITLEKFYRITGKSNQYIGLVPDVEIPTLLDEQMPREKTNPSALKNDEIDIKLKYQLFKNNNYSNAIQKSKERLQNSVETKEIETLNTQIKPYFESSFPPITLQFESVFDDVSKINLIWNEVKTYSEKEYPIQVEQNKIDLEYQKFDEFLKTISATRSKALKQNFALVEAINILTDLTP
ncbi:hypothetical protein G6042_14085 [Flavobacterium sp. SE-s27]|uniref:Tail specific protease domain-containing protein n=2 Tax=Flavobacterium solisilvae TaxID=1852019 RepID=A0ABX1QYX4_9FLAO|nr:hypothetical protein [Flavobacterium solisilvae]